MNDLVRQMCINTMKKSSFDISNPSYIMGGHIKNEATLKQLDLNSEANGGTRHKIDTLSSTPLGKLLQRALKDFNFHADYYNETNGDGEEYVRLKNITCRTHPYLYIPLKKNDSHPVN